jgi:hypothetical protein
MVTNSAKFKHLVSLQGLWVLQLNNIYTGHSV